MTQKDRFLGAWHVCELVFNGDGTFAGSIRQLRRLTQLASGAIRVWQRCEPDTQLTNHPMAEFAGEWVFDLTIDGRRRRYAGPDVVGYGLPFGKGMIGRGVWPRFGRTFHSYSIMPTENLQYTGGTFFEGDRVIAQIAGIAIPESETANEWPNFSAAPSTTKGRWHGKRTTIRPDGTISADSILTRVGQNGLICDTVGENTTTELAIDGYRISMQNGEAVGTTSTFGPLRTGMLYGPDDHMQFIEVVDRDRDYLVGLWQFFYKGELLNVETLVARQENR